MRTIPEIVAEMKNLISELEQHTGLPPNKEQVNDSINFNFDNMAAGQPAHPVFSHYETSGQIFSVNSFDSDTITLNPIKN
jgi:hypothetical protein